MIYGATLTSFGGNYQSPTRKTTKNTCTERTPKTIPPRGKKQSGKIDEKTKHIRTGAVEQEFRNSIATNYGDKVWLHLLGLILQFFFDVFAVIIIFLFRGCLIERLSHYLFRSAYPLHWQGDKTTAEVHSGNR